MNANEITFGCEIETTIPAGTIVVGPHGHGYDIPQLPGWKADCDPSIHHGPGRQACEFVSPVFKGADGLRQLIHGVAVIKSLGASVNPSCGLHIHVGFDKSNAEACEKLVSLVSNFEKAIYASTGTKSRERGRWCNGVQRYGAAETALQASRYSRYHVANFATTKPTVEFRAFAGTLNVNKLVGHIRMMVGLVERAMSTKRIPAWQPKPVAEGNSAHRNGEGQTSLARVFYRLGWTKGSTPGIYGAIVGDDLPSIDASKETLMALARKYDNSDRPVLGE